MKILVIGSGGREHALVWKIAQSKLCDKIFCAPGNGGISQIAECVDIKADNIPALLEFVKKEKIDYTVVGPEAALAAGIVDEFNKAGLSIFGPAKAAAQLEASKIFAKEFMAKYNVPTADFKVFDNHEGAARYLKEKGVPCVIKADGLAQGKGVTVAKSAPEAHQAIHSIMHEKIFGAAGAKIIIEDCLEGEEASILVFTDSEDIMPLATAQDHKRIFDNDQGANTGGMGAYSPAPMVGPQLFDEIMHKIIQRVVYGLKQEGIEYRGVLYAGVMLTKDGPKVLEFNVRFGDPEIQAILPRLKSDLLEVMLATSEGRLSRLRALDWDARACVSVVCASGGYPGEYEKAKEIFGLEEAAKIKEVVVFHAGTKKSPATSHQSPVKYFTNGGRVLGVTGLGLTIKEAIKTAYQAVEKISFEGMHYRKDIGHKAIANIKN